VLKAFARYQLSTEKVTALSCLENIRARYLWQVPLITEESRRRRAAMDGQSRCPLHLSNSLQPASGLAEIHCQNSLRLVVPTPR